MNRFKKRNRPTETVVGTRPKRRRVFRGKVEKNTHQTQLTHSTSSNTFANIQRQEFINSILGDSIVASMSEEDQVEDNNHNNTNNSGDNKSKAEMENFNKEDSIELLGASECEIRRKELVARDRNKIREILKKNNVKNKRELRKETAELSNKIDKMKNELNDSDSKRVKEILMAANGSYAVAAQNIKPTAVTKPVVLYIMKRAAESAALEAAETVDNLEDIIVMKLEKEARDRASAAEHALTLKKMKKVHIGYIPLE